MAEKVQNIKMPTKAIVIGDDAAFVPLAVRQLQKMGISDVVHITDGADAWKRMEEVPFELVVMNWTLSSLSAIALFNRLRHHSHYSMIPIIACSSKVRPDDFRLLDEFPCSRLLEKPSSQILFTKCIEAVLEEAEWYKRRRPYLEKLFQDAYNNPDKVKKTIKQLLKDAPNPIPAALMVADILYDQGSYGNAETLYRKVLAHSQESIPALNGVGKVLYKMGKPEEAFSFLRIAWRQSGDNIERLCLLGEIEISQHDPKAATEYFDQALSIDESHAKAHAGVMICQNLDEYVRRNSTVGLKRSFASVCNSIGISLIRNEKMEEGMKQYHAALAFLGADQASSLVMFNMGLGYARWEKWAEAYKWFEKSSKISNPEFKKAHQWMSRLAPVLQKASGAEFGESLIQFEGDTEVSQLNGEDIDSTVNESVEGVDVEDDWFEDIYD